MSFTFNLVTTNPTCPLSYQFASLKDFPRYGPLVKRILNQPLYQLYGLHKLFPNKITGSAEGRVCELLLIGNQPQGIIIYKTILQNLSIEKAVKKSLIIEMLYAVHVGKEVKKGYRTLLINRIFEVARQHDAQGVHTIILDDAQDDLNFFSKKNFNTIQSYEDQLPGGKKKKHLIYYDFLRKELKKTSKQN
jgi:hypothetical protein